MVSALYILHWPDRDIEFLRCEVIIHRNFHNDVPDAHLMVSKFVSLYRKLQPHERTPCLQDHGVSYMYIWGENDILLLAATPKNVNVMLAMTFLRQFYMILQHYFVKSESSSANEIRHDTDIDIEENKSKLLHLEHIVDNVALVYELLDECVDYGVIQLTDYNILKEYIKMEINQASSLQEALDADDSDMDVSDSAVNSRANDSEKKIAEKKARQKQIKSTHNHAVGSDMVRAEVEGLFNSSILRTQALAISWRPKGIFYSKNEIYIDIIEESEFLYDLESNTIKLNEIKGACQVKSYLSGMPQCKLGLNEKYISQIEYDAVGEDEAEQDEVEEDGDSLIHRKDNLISNGGFDDDRDTTESEESSLNLKYSTKKLKVPISNVQFHQCIELSSIYKENLIYFTPPDGQFQLLAYSVDQQRRKDKQPIIMVSPRFRIFKKEAKLLIMCTLSTHFKKRLHCRNLVVSLPVNPYIFILDNQEGEDFRFKAELGEVRYKVDTSEVLWSIADLPGSKKTVHMMAEILLQHCDNIGPHLIQAVLSHNFKGKVGGDDVEESALAELDKYYGVQGVSKSAFGELQKRARNNFVSNDIRVGFEIPLMAYSGLRVNYLRVDEEVLKYTCFPWVRYLTHTSINSQQDSNGYRFRMGPTIFEIM